jgi:hypothetical protein
MSLHQDRIDAMRGTMRRRVRGGRSLDQINVDLALRADEHRLAMIGLVASQHENHLDGYKLMRSQLGQIEKATHRVASKIKQLNTTIAWGIVALGVVLIVKTLIYHFK